ncbi:MAG: M20/M25/M40 family metallo-hydrolase, partial [Acidobacteria bacterium]|nr:M20/M25/M40 family metallo-hydrolase [Acidobacteriota bacterium]
MNGEESSGTRLNLKGLLAYCESTRRELLGCLEAAVKIESPTSSKPDVDRMARFCAGKFRELGGKVRLLRHPMVGCGLTAEFWSGLRPGKPLLVLGHLDTVWDVGTLSEMPFRVRAGRACGPGIFDMKSGIVCGLWAIRALRESEITPARPIRFFLNSDEETSSLAFRKELIAEARGARAVLVLE